MTMLGLGWRWRSVAMRIGLVAVLAILLAAPARATDHDPLKPPDTSSPRDLMRSFIGGSYAAYHAYLDESVRRRGDLGTMDDMRRAVRTLDLSEVPPALVDDVGLESALLLREVLDRIELPSRSDIPGDDEEALSDKWSIPDTEITIARVKEGPRAGEYLFSPETVQRAHEYYERVKHLPYQPGAAERFYQLYVFAPGWMLPTRWVEHLPAWLSEGYHEQALWQWLALGLVAVAGSALIGLALIAQRVRISLICRGRLVAGWSVARVGSVPSLISSGSG
jgi:MscS family membrane protein